MKRFAAFHMKRFAAFFVLAVCALAFFCAPSYALLSALLPVEGAPELSEVDCDYAFIWMTDTQHYSYDYPFIWNIMTDWIKENHEKLRVNYMFFTGDLVQSDGSKAQWKVADEAMKKLDGVLPYICIAGNHDVGTSTSNYANYNRYFGKNRFADLPTLGGYMGSGEGRYDLFTAGGTDYIAIGFGWNESTDGISWVNKILEKYPERKAILLLHNYITTEGERSSEGEKVFKKVVQKNENVFLVLCGHRYNSWLLTDEIDDDGDGESDRTVYQCMANYQAAGGGGHGYMRIIKVYEDENRMTMETYSPYLMDYNYFDPEDYPNKDAFELKVDF